MQNDVTVKDDSIKYGTKSRKYHHFHARKMKEWFKQKSVPQLMKYSSLLTTRYQLAIFV